MFRFRITNVFKIGTVTGKRKGARKLILSHKLENGEILLIQILWNKKKWFLTLYMRRFKCNVILMRRFFT